MVSSIKLFSKFGNHYNVFKYVLKLGCINDFGRKYNFQLMMFIDCYRGIK